MQKALVLLIFLLIDCRVFAQTNHKAGKTELPDISVFDLKGNYTTLRKLGANKVTLIDNWFIPCPPCFSEMKLIHELFAQYGLTPGINFITICETDPAIAKQFWRKWLQ